MRRPNCQGSGPGHLNVADRDGNVVELTRPEARDGVSSEPGTLMAEFALTSTAFESGGRIPRRHTCDGVDVSPSLTWTEPPPGARLLALVVDDPDAPVGTFTHWLAWGLDPATRGLAEGEAVPSEGLNDFGAVGWRGPCPPRGHGRHRYVFRLHALDGALDLPRGAGRPEVERALAGRALSVAELVGTYER